jgi:hypothetical protein
MYGSYSIMQATFSADKEIFRRVKKLDEEFVNVVFIVPDLVHCYRLVSPFAPNSAQPLYDMALHFVVTRSYAILVYSLRRGFNSQFVCIRVGVAANSQDKP